MTTTALATWAPFVALFPCPPWCDPRLCERRHEVDDDGRLDEVASHSGPVTVIADANGDLDSLHVYLVEVDLNDDRDPPEIAIELNGHRVANGVASISPAKAREFAALLISLADTAEGVTR